MNANATIAAVEQALVEERRAIVALDSAKLEEIAALKESLLADLQLVSEHFKGGADRATKKKITHLFATADANRVLLIEAIDTIAEILGLKGEQQTYDARARM